MDTKQEQLLTKALALVHYLKLLATNKNVYNSAAKAELELNRLMVQLTSLPDKQNKE